MANSNRIEQLENLRNIPSNIDFYEKLAAGKFAQVDSHDGSVVQQYIPVPMTLKSQIGSPVSTIPVLLHVWFRQKVESCLYRRWEER